MEHTKLAVKVFPYRPGIGTGNIIWAERDSGSSYYRVSKFAMVAGKFPSNHPVGGTHSESDRSQMGSGEIIENFRSRGYWASCFPEGDGITWKPLSGQSSEQSLIDIRECFGWNAQWGV